jgi:hypothetical protein
LPHRTSIKRSPSGIFFGAIELGHRKKMRKRKKKKREDKKEEEKEEKDGE